ncbi:MAG TPA: trehalase family glycosidase [Methylomirabilota bacterium]|nr:trehalase family glycosidase [Methylomirabilota bacterium]
MRGRVLAGAVALVALVALAVVAAVLLIGAFRTPDLVAWDELDDRWGTYLSEREWGTPREAIGGDPWGMDYLEAVRIPYTHGEDGIAGLVDRDGTFHIGWAVWDEEQVRVAERLFGWGNPSGEHGEDIVDRRTFGANTPTSSFAEATLVYPNTDPQFRVRFTQARVDSVSGVLAATASRETDDAGELPLHVVLKGWLHDPALRVEPIRDGLLLHGLSSTVVIVGSGLSGQQVSDEKRALDENLRDGGLGGGGTGHIGALAHRLMLGPEEASEVHLAWAEAGTARDAEARARELLGAASRIVATRRAETEGVFDGEVADAHEPVYRQALMSLLWSQSLYRWDGTSSWIPEWEGRVDADDVLIMPDKWEFPWLATWDSAFHAVTAALIDPQLGADQLTFILSDRWRQPDGHIPCAEFVMDDECPPVFAWAAWRMWESGAGIGFLEDVYPGLAANHQYWRDELQVQPGLYTGGFLGMDNLPRAEGQPQADASAWMAFNALHLSRIAEELGETDAAEAYRAEINLIGAAVNEALWDEEVGFYFDRNDDGVSPIRTKSYSGLVPLIAGIVPDERVERVLDVLRDERRFLSQHGIRSTSADSVLYRPGYAGERGANSSWRGPIWLPINYLLVDTLRSHDPAFAEDLRSRLIELVETDWEATGRFHEYFHAETGEGLGADAQAGWTALVANLIAESEE